MARTNARGDQALRWTGVVALVSLVVHGADHTRRGTDVVTTVVTAAGAIGFILASVAVVLVFRGHRLAPLAAILVGFPGAVRFMASHLLPQWSAFSDPFVGAEVAPGVTAFSWLTAIFEIGALLAFGAAGVVVMRRRGRPDIAFVGDGGGPQQAHEPVPA